MRPVLLDTGVLVALLDAREKNHRKCKAALQGWRRPLVTCEAVIAESCYLLRDVGRAPAAVVENVSAGRVQVRPVLPESALEAQALLNKYSDQGIDFADACLIVLAGQLGTGEVLTLDSDFRHYRWAGSQRFTLLPE
jgi:predicted nucleic acid-binding protein